MLRWVLMCRPALWLGYWLGRLGAAQMNVIWDQIIMDDAATRSTPEPGRSVDGAGRGRGRLLKHFQRLANRLGKVGSSCGTAPKVGCGHLSNVNTAVLLGNQQAGTQFHLNSAVQVAKCGDLIEVDKQLIWHSS